MSTHRAKECTKSLRVHRYWATQMNFVVALNGSCVEESEQRQISAAAEVSDKSSVIGDDDGGGRLSGPDYKMETHRVVARRRHGCAKRSCCLGLTCHTSPRMNMIPDRQRIG